MIWYCVGNMLRLAEHNLDKLFSMVMNKSIVGMAMKIRENVRLIDANVSKTP